MKKNLKNKSKLSVGLISDTHGKLRQEAVDALQGSDLIIHAGDIGRDSILDELELIAPVVAVRGNMDTENRARRLPRSEVVTLNGIGVYIIHDISRIDLDPGIASIKVVVYGHSHRPSVKEERGVLYINPGSAGPRRFTLPVSVARLEINGSSVKSKLIKLKIK